MFHVIFKIRWTKESMADRSLRSSAVRKSVLWLFLITSFLVAISWFFLLRSADQGQESLPPNSKILAPRINCGNTSTPHHSKNESDRENHVPDQDRDRQESLSKKNCESSLKVFMYDLPPEFHFGLLGWKSEARGGVWPDLQSPAKIPGYPGGLNLQHSVEYWLTLDLLASTLPDRPGPCTAARRVENSSEADVVFVPFFSSLSYNRYSRAKPSEKASRNHVLEKKLVELLMGREEWRRSGGRDHVVLAHHPNSMLRARHTLWPAIFVLSDFGRYPPNIANVEKDVIAPYKHVITTYVNDSAGFNSRPLLLYFQGAIHRKDGGFVRQELFYLLKGEKDVHFTFGSASRDGIHDASRGMHASKFCLNIAGDTPSSNRLFDAIASHCVPVIISDDIELPYEDVLDYSKFCVFVRTSDALRKGFLISMIRSIGEAEWTRMWHRIKHIQHHFEFQYPSKKDDAVDMIWQAVARKVSAVRLKVHRARRFALSDARGFGGRSRTRTRTRTRLELGTRKRLCGKHSKASLPFGTF